MAKRRTAGETIRFVNEYCAHCEHLFKDGRSFEHLKLLHVGMICELARKSLPAVTCIVEESHSPGLHHFFVEGE